MLVWPSLRCGSETSIDASATYSTYITSSDVGVALATVLTSQAVFAPLVVLALVALLALKAVLTHTVVLASLVVLACLTLRFGSTTSCYVGATYSTYINQTNVGSLCLPPQVTVY